MTEHLIIDGNNLLHAMHAHAPIPNVGRETLVRLIERWATPRSERVTLVFDGPVPRGGLARQMRSKRMAVRFSAPLTADDVIVELVKTAVYPTALRIVTGDNAIRLEASYRRCVCTGDAEFVRELFARTDKSAGNPSTQDSQDTDRQGDGAGRASDVARSADGPNGDRRDSPEPKDREKPGDVTPDEAAGWLETFGIDQAGEEPFDGHDALTD